MPEESYSYFLEGSARSICLLINDGFTSYGFSWSVDDSSYLEKTVLICSNSSVAMTFCPS